MLNARAIAKASRSSQDSSAAAGGTVAVPAVSEKQWKDLWLWCTGQIKWPQAATKQFPLTLLKARDVQGTEGTCRALVPTPFFV